MLLVITQDGTRYETVRVILQGNKILLRDSADGRKNRVAGVYETKERAAEVYKEILEIIDEFKVFSYQMPAK